ncbi:hypothetical protein GCM10007320_09040 [Pseudorhodoferax aquiterrae]|uniref:Uncharacterized protein n=1 Tax=Pseudorhodoferax aquiterrae TaxID=747304 RepID=A0ABQ3FWK0_9BURK|nr:hypothetical protein [Pseudorhodoferax aquiterrae]GHC72860.1 hypothetical protein GCM10007320_09040 [Pseudorhodoferax aquiterrae]
MTPYNTGKVQIGRFYAPPARTQQSDTELQLQRALIDPGCARMCRQDKAITAFCLVVLAGVIAAAVAGWV